MVNATTRPLYPWKESQYTLYRRLGGFQGRSRRVLKNPSPPGFDPRTVQPVASHYIIYAVPSLPLGKCPPEKPKDITGKHKRKSERNKL